MTTVYDWLTVALFAGLVTHFLSFSEKPEADDISFGHYLLLSVLCAAANWLGNHDWDLAAVVVLLAGGGYAYRFLRPPPRSAGH
jgi:hypothetical protein